MARWAPDPRGRLESAAFDLFETHGFAATTVPEIAERAGLTTRTFFRHFADKREVLFAEAAMTAFAQQAIEEVPSDLTPIEAVRHLLHRAAAERFSGQSERIGRVRAIVATDSTLRERDLAKRHDLSAAVAEGFLARGVDEVRARLLGDLTVSVMYLAVGHWLASPASSVDLEDIVDEVLEAHAGLHGTS